MKVTQSQWDPLRSGRQREKAVDESVFHEAMQRCALAARVTRFGRCSKWWAQYLMSLVSLSLEPYEQSWGGQWKLTEFDAVEKSERTGAKTEKLVGLLFNILLPSELLNSLWHHSTGLWRHSSEIFVHIDMIASHSFTDLSAAFPWCESLTPPHLKCALLHDNLVTVEAFEYSKLNVMLKYCDLKQNGHGHQKYSGNAVHLNNDQLILRCP